MTWKTARQALTKRWWFLVLCAVVAAAAAGFVAHRQKPNYMVTITIHDVPGVNIGFAQIAGNTVKFKTLVLDQNHLPWRVENWESPAVAKRAVAGSGIPASTFLQKLALPSGQQQNPKSLDTNTLKPSTLTFTYPAFAHPAVVAQVMQKYFSIYVSQRVARLSAQIPIAKAGYLQDAEKMKHSDSIADQKVTSGSGSAIQHEWAHDMSAAAALDGITPNGGLGTIINAKSPAKITNTKKPLNAGLAAAGGAVVGFLAGILLLLALRWGRNRITDASELAPLDRPIITVNSGERQGLQTLRSELEISGIGETTAVVSVATSELGEGRSELALELARTFARAGISTALVSADWSAYAPSEDRGAAAFLAGTEPVLGAVPLEPDLVWVPYGEEPDGGVTVTSDNVGALVSAARLFARVVVIEVGPMQDDPSARLFAHASDALVLEVNRGKSKGTVVYDSAQTLRRANRAPMIVCFEVGQLRKRGRAMEPERAADAAVIAPTAEIPARS